MQEEAEDKRTYKVVLNHEEQYSIWPAYKENAPGWRDAGKSGSKAECLAYIEETWTDMRPLSLRRKLEQAASAAAVVEPSVVEAEPEPPSLVDRLCEGSHKVVASRSGTPARLREQLQGGFVILKFPDTRGGTELGVKLERAAGEDLATAGAVEIVGNLTLDYVPVRVRAKIDLTSLEGRGQLERA